MECAIYNELVARGANVEVRGLKRIKDSFRKIVVVGDLRPMYTDDCGITYVGLMAFMLDKSILEKVG